ncbi:hypothetical protein ACFTSF_11790 [Kribbella sp. NPDC056951]|uniref:hypothetical protein n=1 Tax=Kribbella sp. NPDC056951 TaxID=3345978 RepID=UPI0036337B1F
MSLRPRRVPAGARLIGVLAGLMVVGVSIALVFVEESRSTRVTLCTLVGVGIGVVMLVSAPALRPHPALAGRRRRGVAGFGRLLVVICWLLRVVVAGTTAAYIAWNSHSAEIQPLAAALVALSMTLLVIAEFGQHLAGFVTAADELRGTGLVRRAGAIVVAAVSAGVAGYVADLVERLKGLVVDPVWDHAREQWGWPSFLAGVLVTLTTILVVTLLAIVVGAAMLSIAFAVGPWTRLGRLLMKYSPVKYARWLDGAYISVVGFSASFPKAPDERVVHWIYQGVRNSSGPLEPIFLKMLKDDVDRARVALAPEATVVLRAVGDHEEIVAEGLPAGAGGPLVTELLPDFPEAAALRRIRLGLHDIPLGLPSMVRVEPPEADANRDYWEKEREWEATREEPAWFSSEPSHDDLVKEVVRHPPGPPWVRERLGLPEVHLDW